MSPYSPFQRLMHRFLTVAARLFQTGHGRWLVLGWLVVLIGGSAVAADVNFIAIVKGQTFEQTGPDLVALKEQNNPNDDPPLSFEGFVEGSTAASLVSGNLQLPGGALIALLRNGPSETSLRSDWQSESLLDLDTARPNGTYTLDFTTQNEGPFSISLALTGDIYPNVPQVKNFTALQSITPTADTLIEWFPMVGGAVTDFILCNVWDQETNETVFTTGMPGSDGALNGLAENVTMPADTLQAGRSYGAEILFCESRWRAFHIPPRNRWVLQSGRFRNQACHPDRRGARGTV